MFGSIIIKSITFVLQYYYFIKKEKKKLQKKHNILKINNTQYALRSIYANHFVQIFERSFVDHYAAIFATRNASVIDAYNATTHERNYMTLMNMNTTNLLAQMDQRKQWQSDQDEICYKSTAMNTCTNEAQRRLDCASSTNNVT